jgi:crossover junction endodeoxyribonuclease RuvC
MRVIGVDPGTVCCGYGIVDIESKGKSPVYVTCGDVRMNNKKPLPERLKTLYDSLGKIIADYSPDHLCIEKIFYHKSIRSSLTLGSARGIIMLLAAENSIPVFEYNATELKMALTGFGRAEKRQVKDMVFRVISIDSPESISDDSTDALALAICHINTSYELK